jgi:hypothetical protein
LTVIAFDGKTLAADKACATSGYISTVTKLFRINGLPVALSGDETAAMAFLAWFGGARDPAAYPKLMETEETNAYVLEKDGFLRRYGKGPHPARIEDTHFAAGCGRDYALAAMYLGKDAVEAVKVACALDTHCGKGCDSMEL